MKRITSAALLAASIICLAPAAHAAISVIGNGLAHSCFESAETGDDAVEGIATCTDALEQTAMTARDRAATYVNRGILYARLDRSETAIRDYDMGLSINPDLGEGYVDRGAALIVLKRYDDALQDINKGIALNSNRVQIAYYDRALIQEALGNIRAAYEDYKKAVEIEPGFQLATEQLSRFKIVRRQGDGT